MRGESGFCAPFSTESDTDDLNGLRFSSLANAVKIIVSEPIHHSCTTAMRRLRPPRSHGVFLMRDAGRVLPERDAERVLLKTRALGQAQITP